MVQVVDESDLILINGCLCCNLSLYADCPECIGASCKGELLCCVQRFCFKAGMPPLTCCESFVDKEVCCQIGLCCCAIGVKCPSTCIKHQGQCCCIVENVAIPCDSEIPMYRGGVLVSTPSTDWRNGSASDSSPEG